MSASAGSISVTVIASNLWQGILMSSATFPMTTFDTKADVKIMIRPGLFIIIISLFYIIGCRHEVLLYQTKLKHFQDVVKIIALWLIKDVVFERQSGH